MRTKSTVRGLASAPHGVGHAPSLSAQGPQTADTEASAGPTWRNVTWGQGAWDRGRAHRCGLPRTSRAWCTSIKHARTAVLRGAGGRKLEACAVCTPAMCTGGRDGERRRSSLRPQLLSLCIPTFRDTAPQHGRGLGASTTQGAWEEDRVPSSAGGRPLAEPASGRAGVPLGGPLLADGGVRLELRTWCSVVRGDLGPRPVAAPWGRPL